MSKTIAYPNACSPAGCLKRTNFDSLYMQACEIVANRYKPELLRKMADLSEQAATDEQNFLDAVAENDYICPDCGVKPCVCEF